MCDEQPVRHSCNGRRLTLVPPPYLGTKARIPCAPSIYIARTHFAPFFDRQSKEVRSLGDLRTFLTAHDEFHATDDLL
jgi:hypothetical protein